MIDTKNLRMLAGAANKPVFVDFMTTVELLELLDALERKDNLLREQLTICKYLSRSICMTDETGADTNPDNIVDSSIEAITKEIGT